jgi:hypothetical protein
VSRTTGPILAIGGITLANKVIFHGEPMDWRIAIATGISAAGFALAEKAWEKGAVALAWVALVTVLFTRIDAKVPGPIETLDNWWKEQR